MDLVCLRGVMRGLHAYGLHDGTVSYAGCGQCYKTLGTLRETQDAGPSKLRASLKARRYNDRREVFGSMSILHFRSIERRRTARAALCMNVLAYGEQCAGEKFKYWTQTVSVSAHGGVIVEEGKMMAGQKFNLMNQYNRKKAECRVVSMRRGRDGVGNVAFEFVEGGENFWSMTFPASGAKPLRRVPGKRE